MTVTTKNWMSHERRCPVGLALSTFTCLVFAKAPFPRIWRSPWFSTEITAEVVERVGSCGSYFYHCAPIRPVWSQSVFSTRRVNFSEILSLVAPTLFRFVVSTSVTTLLLASDSRYDITVYARILHTYYGRAEITIVGQRIFAVAGAHVL